jgi:all-trans-8'-apo-beta-carotenal 15,15'-oxygenase
MSVIEISNKTAGAAPKWMTLLGKSESGNRDYVPIIEGNIPEELAGSLFRNGPGLFETGGIGIEHVLDGDGLVQRLSIDNGKVRYQNRFVETDKLKAERKSGKRVDSTWSTRKSSNPLANLGGNVTSSQAGVTVYPVHGHILARDELGPSYELDPQTLATIGTIDLPTGFETSGVKAHSKIDPKTDDWIVAGTRYGPKMKIDVAIYESGLKLKTQFSIDAPRQVYIHDFVVSENYLIFVLHPCYISPVPFLMGIQSFMDGFKWRPSDGNSIVVVSKDGSDVRHFDAPASFMWHSLNAFEKGGVLVVDFVGYDDPDHFIGDRPLLRTLMQGKLGKAQCHGTIRRYEIDLNGCKLDETILDGANHEFPMLDGRLTTQEHRYGYFAYSGLGAFNTGLKRFDYQTGTVDAFDFGSATQVGEPVFIEKPGSGLDDGWLISQCLDGESKRTFFAMFNASRIADGPVAQIELEHHVPISFHGSWIAS